MKVLCIATHPDDETLGCGGTLLRHRAESNSVSWLIVTDATSARFTPEFREARERQIAAVAARFRFDHTFRLGLPAAGLDRLAEDTIIKGLHDAIQRAEPDVVYVNHGGDAHSDHRIVFRCAAAALKPFRTGLRVRRFLAYETISETDQAPPEREAAFLANSFVDVSEFIDGKIDILKLYESEVQPFPLPREESAVRALARLRGAALGVPAAEAFMLIREAR